MSTNVEERLDKIESALFPTSLVEPVDFADEVPFFGFFAEGDDTCDDPHCGLCNEDPTCDDSECCSNPDDEDEEPTPEEIGAALADELIDGVWTAITTLHSIAEVGTSEDAAVAASGALLGFYVALLDRVSV